MLVDKKLTGAPIRQRSLSGVLIEAENQVTKVLYGAICKAQKREVPLFSYFKTLNEQKSVKLNQMARSLNLVGRTVN